jgi:hypothetical protein
MKAIFLIITFCIAIFADSKREIFNLYQLQEYERACQTGINHLNKFRDDENYVTLFAFSCLNSDRIDRITTAIPLLKATPEARANAAYLSTIVMQKKLLEHSLNDAFMLRQFKFPTTDNVLSKVFDLYSKQKTLNKTAEYEFVEPSNEKVHYKLYLEGSSSSNYIVIEEWLQSQLIKKHMYK